MKKASIAIICIVSFLFITSASNAYWRVLSKELPPGTSVLHIEIVPFGAYDSLFDDINMWIEKDENARSYSVRITYRSNKKKWISVPKGKTLSFLLEGQIITLDGDGSMGNRYYELSAGDRQLRVPESEFEALSEFEQQSVWSVEELTYSVALKDLQAISKSHEVRFVLRGSENYISRPIKERSLKELQRFIE